MAEDMLKKFYFKILKLLQNKDLGIGISPAKALEILKESGGKTGVGDLLLKLGLHDVHALIESLRGQDIRSLSVENVEVQPIVVEYLQSCLNTLGNELKQQEQFSAPNIVKNYLQGLSQQFELWQTMLSGLKNNDFFLIMNSLIQAYPHHGPELKKNIVATLRKVGKPVVLALVHSLYQDQPKHNDLPELLKEMGSLAIPALIVALQYPEESVRYGAVDVLKAMKVPECVPGLIESLQDPSQRIRQLAAAALGEIRDSRAIPGLINALQDQHAAIRLEAVRSLGKLGNPNVLPACLSLLQDPSWEVRKQAVDAVSTFGPLASAFLAKALENDSLVVRKIAARILAEIGTQEAVPALMKALTDKDISVRERAVVALGRIQGEDGLVTLMYALEDKAPLVRFAAIEIIISVGSRSTLHLLNKALKDAEPVIRQRANLAIQAILKREEKIKS